MCSGVPPCRLVMATPARPIAFSRWRHCASVATRAGYKEMTERLGMENARIEGVGPMPFFGFRRGDDERMKKFIDVFYTETFIFARWTYMVYVAVAYG